MMFMFGVRTIPVILQRCIHMKCAAPSCTAHNLPTTNVRDDFRLSHAIASLGVPFTAEKQYKERSRAVTTHIAAVVLNGLCSEAVALIGEVVAVRWYFLRDKAQVLYPMADVCGKGQDLSRPQQQTYTRFRVQISIALCDPYLIEDRTSA